MKLVSSIIFIVLGCILQLYRILPDKFIKHLKKRLPYLNTITIIMSILLIIYGGYKTVTLLIESHKYNLFVSPEEIEVHRQTNKEFILKVTNNYDFPLYDIQLEMLVQRGDLKSNKIKLKPIKKVEGLPGNVMGLFGYDKETGKQWQMIMFADLNAHSTKEFLTIADCTNCAENSTVTFEVTHWSNSPSSFSFKPKKDFNKAPKNFEDFFKK
jgi:hypothetical protein